MHSNPSYFINVYPINSLVHWHYNEKHVSRFEAILGADRAKKRIGNKCLYRIHVRPKICIKS